MIQSWQLWVHAYLCINTMMMVWYPSCKSVERVMHIGFGKRSASSTYIREQWHTGIGTIVATCHLPVVVYIVCCRSNPSTVTTVSTVTTTCPTTRKTCPCPRVGSAPSPTVKSGTIIRTRTPNTRSGTFRRHPKPPILGWPNDGPKKIKKRNENARRRRR